MSSWFCGVLERCFSVAAANKSTGFNFPLTRPGKEPQKTYGKDPPLLMGKS